MVEGFLTVEVAGIEPMHNYSHLAYCLGPWPRSTARLPLTMIIVRAMGIRAQPVETESSSNSDQSVPGTVTLMMRGVSARCGGSAT